MLLGFGRVVVALVNENPEVILKYRFGSVKKGGAICWGGKAESGLVLASQPLRLFGPADGDHFLACSLAVPG